MNKWGLKEYLELAFWLVVSICVFAFHFCGWFEFIHAQYRLEDTSVIMHYLMPSQLHQGLAGFSFISVTTGLNLAMVKFEVFSKSLKEIELQWQDEIDEQLSAYPSSRVDDEKRTMIDAYLEKHIKSKTKIAYTEHKDLGLKWRWLAIRLNIIGLLCLFFQLSAGLLGIIFVFPVLGAVQAKQRCKGKLKTEIETLLNFAASTHDDQQALQSDVNKVIQSATPTTGK